MSFTRMRKVLFLSSSSRLMTNMLYMNEMKGNTELLDILSKFMTVLQGETLVISLWLVGPLLATNPSLCASFMQGILSLDPVWRAKLMMTQTSSDVIEIHWKIKNVKSHILTRYTRLGRDWWFFGMSMGLLKVVGESKSFGKAHYEVLCPIIELSNVLYLYLILRYLFLHLETSKL
jgi:hypothetical protein